VMRRLFPLTWVVCLSVVGCSSGTADLSQERSPSATGPDVKSTGPAKVKAEYKTAPVGAGDGLVPMKSK